MYSKAKIRGLYSSLTESKEDKNPLPLAEVGNQTAECEPHQTLQWSPLPQPSYSNTPLANGQYLDVGSFPKQFEGDDGSLPLQQLQNPQQSSTSGFSSLAEEEHVAPVNMETEVLTM